MNGLGHRGQLLARILISLVFLLNAVGTIDQTVPAHELMERGLPQSLVPFAIISGRALQLAAGLALIFGVQPRLAAAALFVFLVPATFVSHSFWLSARTPAYMGQLINFSKNAAILGGLLFVVSTAGQPTMVRFRRPDRRSHGSR